ncbi:nucleotidyltransferase domain-containing protein [Vibrio sp. Of7-15]|uniref:nucleotidyltransferase domain-containing protein n=1 Tax=Vibrio sp. Of7-15 TaxID=2724879 RepID=UPI001EF32A6D|nr:nucleotidyltransferase domain-containing protein [Vibrio sp. Of7-15]MCG7497126.1 nucleotidyltransferase domain-containing protein [Vibrio sp. Of7-15]
MSPCNQLTEIDPKAPFQPVFAPVIQDLIVNLRAAIGPSLHSIYLFGSVARREGKPGKSNLDVTFVSTVPLTSKQQTILNTIKWRFKSQYPQITGITFNVGETKEILSLESIFSWGFWLKHCCVCIYGDDLATRFGSFEPCWEIAKNLNMDIEEWLDAYRKKIVAAQTPEAQVPAQIVITKKLLRSCYSLVMHRDKSWYDNPVTCGEKFLDYYPDKSLEIERLNILLQGRRIPKRSVIALLDNFGGWVVKEFARIERKIG